MSETPTAGHLWIVLTRCYKALSMRVEQTVSNAGMGLTDFMILEALLHKGPLTISEIQGKILLASGSMTAAVDRLERKGAIARRAIQQDRRARRLELTAEGRRVIERIFREHAAEFESLIDILDDSEKRQTHASLKKLGLHAAATRNPREDKKASPRRRIKQQAE